MFGMFAWTVPAVRSRTGAVAVRAVDQAHIEVPPTDEARRRVILVRCDRMVGEEWHQASAPTGGPEIRAPVGVHAMPTARVRTLRAKGVGLVEDRHVTHAMPHSVKTGSARFATSRSDSAATLTASARGYGMSDFSAYVP